MVVVGAASLDLACHQEVLEHRLLLALVRVGLGVTADGARVADFRILRCAWACR